MNKDPDETRTWTKVGRPAFVWLNRPPVVGTAGGTVPIKIGIMNRSLVILVPVNMLNNVPKGLKLNVQGDFQMTNNFADNDGCITTEGKIYVWSQDIRRVVHRKIRKPVDNLNLKK